MSEPVPAQAPVVKFDPSEAEVAKIRADIKPLVDDPDLFKTKDGYKKGHEARMVLRGIRVAIEKIRVGSNEDAQKWIRGVNAEAKRRTAPVSEYEDVLDRRQKEQDKTEEAAAVAAANAERDHIAAEAKAKADAEAAERKKAIDAEVAKLAAERAKFDAEQAEARRIAKVEDDRRRAEQVERDRIDEEDREKRRAEQKAIDDELKAQKKMLADIQAEIDEKSRLAREARERAEREAFQKEAQEKARIQAEADAERKAGEKRSMDEVVAKVAERQAKIKAEEEAAEKKRLEEAKPDVDKVRAFAVQLEDAIKVIPELKDNTAHNFMVGIVGEIDSIMKRCKEFEIPKKPRTKAAR